MRQWLAGWLCLILLAGCGGVPFQKTVYVPLEIEDPQAAVERFKMNSPESFQLLNTIVFQYNWMKFSGLGYIRVNTPKKTFAVVCINHMGVKLFELSGDEKGTATIFALEEFTRKGDLPAVVGEDIKRIYFDQTPSSEAAIVKEKTRIIFRQPSGAGITEYIFAGAEVNLTEKSYYEDDALVWRVSYYEYQSDEGKLYPRGIILKNYKYGYGFMVKLKEIRH
jgi:hypothetical protein